MNETEPKPGDTAADMKMKIEKRQAEAGKPLSEGKTPDVKVIDQKSLPEPKATETAKSETPQPLNGAASEAIEWARKKGLETPEAIAKQLREMEAEFHRRNQNKGEGWKPPEKNVPRETVTPSRPYIPRQNLEGLSKTYNIPQEDMERVLPLIMDAISAQKAPLEEELANIKKDNMRNSEFTNLMADPYFTNAQVQAEMHKILGEHPEAFEKPEPFKWAYEQSMVEIARRNLQGSASQNIPYMPSNRPPVTAGNVGSGTGERENADGRMSMEKFSSMDSDEQRKYLSKSGLIEKKYY